jgi:hypothetical protein
MIMADARFCRPRPAFDLYRGLKGGIDIVPSEREPLRPRSHLANTSTLCLLYQSLTLYLS